MEQPSPTKTAEAAENTAETAELHASHSSSETAVDESNLKSVRSSISSRGDTDLHTKDHQHDDDILDHMSKLSVGAYDAVKTALMIADECRRKCERLEEKLRSLDSYKFDNIAEPLPKPGEPAYDIWDLKTRTAEHCEGLDYFAVLFQNDAPKRWLNYDKLGNASDAIKLVRQGDSSRVLVERFGIKMTPNHLSCLDGPNWLNDEVINFFIGMVQERNDFLIEQSVEKVPKCFCFNTFFFNMLSGGDDPKTNYNYRAVSRWTTRRKVDVFAVDILLIPVHAYKAHWCLGVVDMRPASRRILLFDSLRGSHRMFFKNIRRWLQDEHMDKKGEPLSDINEWKYNPTCETERLAPRQQNGHDCGMFLCLYAECISIGKRFDFSQRDISMRRVKMVQQILRGSIFK
ncbi:ulp1 protease family, C-terminal catalytic domain containing protein [Babesia divergens]|uniref:Ulp1 protease family, C-terminal catalytic domain containing protein n=1 Tax=Babesia divergens TaxID=32595 RepID=A0AAD9GHT5_BABDI|nr:ulp1 protease family, C-terminal catalytic domain containing protein [Babesia divergens]